MEWVSNNKVKFFVCFLVCYYFKLCKSLFDVLWRFLRFCDFFYIKLIVKWRRE